MQTIIGVKFKTNSKVYYFSPLDEIFEENDYVIVETAKGLEFGIVTIPNKEVDDKEIKHELKPIIRKATEKDKKQILKLNDMKKDALKVTAQKAEARKLKMKIVDCEYAFDGKKVTIYFTADGRIDFRDLVKDLASAFHARIELRQIYERDDIRMRGALAPCGRPCCCSSHLLDYEKVTIKMAKVQGLSLSPTKISGMCGKLMCCLKYESEYYLETAKTMPKPKSRVTTPEGEGIVEQVDMLRKEVLVKISKGDDAYSYVRYPVEKIIGKDKIDINTTDPDDNADELPNEE